MKDILEMEVTYFVLFPIIHLNVFGYLNWFRSRFGIIFVEDKTLIEKTEVSNCSRQTTFRLSDVGKLINYKAKTTLLEERIIFSIR